MSSDTRLRRFRPGLDAVRARIGVDGALLAIVAAVWVGLYLRGLGDPPIRVWDESRYATPARHMVEHGGWLDPKIRVGTHAVVMKYAFGESLLPHLPRLVLTVALVLFGFQLVMFGVLAEMLTRLLYRDERPYRIRRTYDGSSEP